MLKKTIRCKKIIVFICLLFLEKTENILKNELIIHNNILLFFTTIYLRMVEIKKVIQFVLLLAYFAILMSILIISVSLNNSIEGINNVNIEIWFENCSTSPEYNQTIGQYGHNISLTNTTDEIGNITDVFKESYYYTTISWGSENTNIYRYLNGTNGTLLIDENAKLKFGYTLYCLSITLFAVLTFPILGLMIGICVGKPSMIVETQV